ncbi:MAG: methyltransferase domain-containing protein [Mariprofundaceae bacterium]
MPASLATDKVEAIVRDRYSDGAKARQEALCCPVDYDPRYLEAIPAEVLERDYGCGDPSAYVLTGDTVLDLGSGGGKICFIAAQVAGSEGRIIGIDKNTDMLELANRARPLVAEAIGCDNVEFKRGRIQDLRTDLDLLGRQLTEQPVNDLASWLAFERVTEVQRQQRPLVADDSIDLVVSNCVLNLVSPADKQGLFAEIYRVLKPGGRIAISDIVADRDIPGHLQHDAELWSGCISGAFREGAFLAAFEQAGFVGVYVDKRQQQPWQVVEDIEFRSVTVCGHKPGAEPRQAAQACCAPNQSCC